MSTIPSATAASTTVCRLPIPSSQWNKWNNRTIFLLIGAGAALYLIYRLFKHYAGSSVQLIERQTLAPLAPPPTRPERRFLNALFVEESVNATHFLPFSAYATGIIRINAEDVASEFKFSTADVFIECLYQDQCFFTQKMAHVGDSLEVVVPEMPFKEKMTLRIYHDKHLKTTAIVQIDHRMSVYEIIKEDHQWTVESHPYSPPERKKMSVFLYPLNIDDRLSLFIDLDEEIRLESPPSDRAYDYFFRNKTNIIHILFFQIMRPKSERQSEENYVVPITVFPQSTVNLPKGFLRRCWESACLSVHKSVTSYGTLQLRCIRDTIVEPLDH